MLLSFWAKLGTETWPDKYHPVLCHLIDVGQVARHVWNEVLRPRVRRRIATQLGLADENAAGAWLAFWTGAHDIGKVSPDFQAQGKTYQLKARLAPAFNFDNTGGKKPHGDVSTAVLATELSRGHDWPAVDPPTAQAVAVAVGGHHGMFPTDWNPMIGPLGNERWATTRRELLAELARLFGVTNLPPSKPSSREDQSVWMYVAGLTSVADWIGSNQEFFRPYGNAKRLDRPFDADRYFRRADYRARRALKRLGWLSRSGTTTPMTFGDLFPALKGMERPLQTAVVEIVAGKAEPGLLIVEAPMGEGKTEAAWYAAVNWNRHGGQGAYVALPTMATSNQMFERVGEFLKADTGGNLLLLHGKAALNKQFERLKKYAAQVYDNDERPSAVVAEGWFAANKKHGLLAPYGVGTIDQALLAVLQTKHVFVRLFGLAGKCVILDEVHAYDAYMTTLMERLLRWLAALGCPVVLLSATLPKARRQALIDAYAPGAVLEGESAKYPRVTSVRSGAFEEKHVDADPNRARTVQLGWLKVENLAGQLRMSLADGGCAAVIRNTVGLAQDTYLQLRDALKGDGIEVELFHARFPFGRRMEIETAVLQRFGKGGGPAERDKRILVATQVVEQSLDLDFDVMVSDVAPVDLVLQRAGRLHRHERGARPESVNEPRVWLIEPGEEEGLPDFGVSGIVYAPYILYRSLLALRFNGSKPRDKFELPSEIETFVDQVYEDAPAPDSLSTPEQAFWEATQAKHREAIEKEEAEAETRQIRKPQFSGVLARVVKEPREEDNPDLHPAHQALTRLSRPTVSLICLDMDENGAYRLPHDNSPVQSLAIRKMSQGGFQDISRLMLGEVTSAHWGVINELRHIPRTPSEWEEVGMLCRHHLITFTKGKATLGAYELFLDNFLGLTIARANVQGEDE